MEAPRRAAIYGRMSEAKADEGWQQRQIDDGHAIAARKGATVAPDDIYIETNSASRFSTKARREYLRLLRKIEADGLDLVVTWMEDRAHRQVLELAEFIALCREHNVTVATPGIEYDLDDPDQVSMWFIKVRFAEAEVEKTSKRLRRQRLQAAENGERHSGGSRAFGFTGSGRNKVSLARALAEQDMIREAAARIVAGDSLRSIVIDWNRRRIPSAQNRRWNNSVLRRLLLSPRIAGYRSHKGMLHEATDWQPIIPREQWQAVKAILEDPARATTVGGGQPKYLLTGLILCGVCGQPLRCRTFSTGIRAYYCADTTGIGGHVHRNAAKVEELILEGLFRAVEDNAAYNDAVKGLDNGDPTRPVLERLAVNRARLDGLKAKEDQALELELDGRTDDAKRLTATIERLRARYEQEMERDRAELGRLQGDRVLAHVPPNLREVWPDLSLDRRRAILAAVLRGKRIVIDPQGQGPRFDVNAVRIVPQTPTWQSDSAQRDR
jgi:site-specific DNA recombinase